MVLHYTKQKDLSQNMFNNVIQTCFIMTVEHDQMCFDRVVNMFKHDRTCMLNGRLSNMIRQNLC